MPRRGFKHLPVAVLAGLLAPFGLAAQQFTDDPLIPGETAVKAVHFSELRERIDSLRQQFELPFYSWTDPALQAGSTPIRAAHLNEMRAALDQAYAAAWRTSPVFSDSPLQAGAVIKAVHVQELREAVRGLEVPHELSTIAGEDWSLSADVRPKPGTGLLTMGAASARPEVQHRGHTVTWAELNPAEGSFDWSPITSWLDDAVEGEYGVVLRVKANVTERQSPWGSEPAVPQWVLDKHSPPVVDLRNNSPNDYIKVAAPWHAGLQLEHLAWIERFGLQGFLDHPNLLGVYVHGISTSFGEEFWFDRPAFDNLTAAGMTPELLEQAFTVRLNAWAAAFGSQTARLAWVSVGWLDATPEEASAYRQVKDNLNSLAHTLGMGTRFGAPERYHSWLTQNGQSIDGDGYLTADDGHALIAEGRYWGGENEDWAGTADEAYEYRTATLRALQMRMRLLWVHDAGVALDSEINHYFSLTAGKRADEAPDAWCLLREADVRQGSDKVELKNFERWLNQREVEGSLTRRTRMKTRAAQPNDWDQPVDWTARSTDRAAGVSRITFTVDHSFLPPGSATPLTLKVTWVDDGAVWRVRHATPAGAIESAPISGTADGKLKTTSIQLVNFSAERTLQDGFDLALVAVQGDLQASVVRLLR